MAVQTPYLTFGLQSACYAVGASSVREILRVPALTPVIEAPPSIIGIVNYRGHMLPIMDLGLQLGLPQREYQLHDHIIVLEQENHSLGILVNEVYGVHDIPAHALETPTILAGQSRRESRLIRHLTTLDTTAIMVLAPALLLNIAENHEVDLTHAPPAPPYIRGQQKIEPTTAGNGRLANPSELPLLFFQNAPP